MNSLIQMRPTTWYHTRNWRGPCISYSTTPVALFFIGVPVKEYQREFGSHVLQVSQCKFTRELKQMYRQYVTLHFLNIYATKSNICGNLLKGDCAKAHIYICIYCNYTKSCFLCALRGGINHTGEINSSLVTNVWLHQATCHHCSSSP